MTFTNTTLGVNEYQWAVDGTNTSTIGNNLEFTFMSAGTHTVSLTATNNDNCSTTYVETIYVAPSPTANFFTPLTICNGNVADFTNNSTDATAYEWFVDGISVGTSEDLSYTFPTSGTYTVNLVATNNNCSDTFENEVTVLDTPSVSFDTPTSICAGQLVTFINTSSNVGSTTYVWYVNGTQESTDFDFDYTFVAGGTYTIALRAISENNCNAVVSTDITISSTSGLDATFTADDTATPTIAFAANMVNINQEFINHAWDFGDGTTSTLANPTHTFAAEGTYSVCHTSSLQNYCDATFCRFVSVAPPCDVEAAFEMIKAPCLGENVVFSLSLIHISEPTRP